jgi:hypothetical protein
MDKPLLAKQCAKNFALLMQYLVSLGSIMHKRHVQKVSVKTAQSCPAPPRPRRAAGCTRLSKKQRMLIRCLLCTQGRNVFIKTGPNCEVQLLLFVST